MRATPFYGEDLARIHHEGFTGAVRGAAPGLLRTLRRTGIRSGLVVDLGCGSGEWLRALGDAGFDAFGVDGSGEFLRLARRVAPRARLLRGDVHRAAIPHCAAVTSLGEVLGYLPAGRAPSLERTFRRVAAALPARGLFLFDLVVAGRKTMSYRSWTGGEGWIVCVEVSEDARRGVLTREIVTFRRAGRGWRRSVERHRLRVPPREEVVAALRAAGFAVRVSRRWGTSPLAPRRLAFEARKGRAP